MEDKDHLHQALEPLGNGKVRTENGKLTYPLRSVAPRPPNLEGQRGLSTHFLPLRQGESRRGGGMMKREGVWNGKLKIIALASALSRRNEVCDPSSASVIR